MSEEDGRVIKQEEDYTKEVDEALPKASALADNGQLHEAIESLMPLEKKSRIAADMKSTSRLLVHIMDMCYQHKDWAAMGEQIIVLMKRRGQLKKAVSDMVTKACEYLEQIPDEATTLKLIDTIRTATTGKIHVEMQRARLTLKLAHIKEAKGEIEEAADVLQELQVETYGSMEKREKVEFILEQMRLCLAKKDWVRAGIIAKKIGTKFFEAEDTDDLKLKYYRQMIAIAQHEERYLDMCRYYREVFDTKTVQDNETQWTEALQRAIVFLILAPFDHEQSDLLPRVMAEPKLEQLPTYRALLDHITSKELVPWRVFEGSHGDVLKSTGLFEGDAGANLWKTLQTRVVEHNIRIVAGYYERISTQRLAELLELDELAAERHLSELVSNGTVTAKIDRPAKVIVFQLKKKPIAVLNDWNNDIKTLMNLVDKATHLMNRERMVHKAE